MMQFSSYRLNDINDINLLNFEIYIPEFYYQVKMKENLIFEIYLLDQKYLSQEIADLPSLLIIRGDIRI